ncbi:MAG: glycosyltransferase family 4 protein [Ignavibacteria bacterium]|nr:glycosyltransferase family 4 protein [Ignavibacteria bacterium]
MSHPPLNILQTCFSHSWGGLELQSMEVSRQMQKRSHQVWLACCTGSRLAQGANLHNIDTLQLNVSGYFHPRLAWKLSRFLKRHNIEIIHCHLSKDIATIVPAIKLAGQRIPILLSKHVGSYISKKDLLHRFTYAHVSRVLAVSEVIHKNILDTTPVTPDRVMTVHDAIDTDRFSPHRVDRRRVRKEFNIADDIVVVGLVGRFSPGKGHKELLEAAAILRNNYPAVHFLIVGEASHGEQKYEQKIKTMCSMLGLQDIVTFTGFRRDVPEVMAAFEIFAFPSHAESFGIVLIEAMGMERPVVSTNCDGVLDIVVDGETGLYVHPRNPSELADALAKLINDESLRGKMGKAGRKRVEEFFDQKRQIEKIQALYYEVRGLKATKEITSVSSAPPTNN